MSADFNTFVHLKGTKEELINMLNILHKYEVDNLKQYSTQRNCAYIDFVQINNHREVFFDNNSKFLNDLSENEISNFVDTCKEGIFIVASGPWGVFGFLDEITLFEEMADVAPNAEFHGSITGWNTGGDQDAEFELIDGLLHSRYAFQTDDECYEEEDDFDDDYDEEDECEDIDKPCEWDVEYVYDPVKHKTIESHYDN